MYMKKLLTRLSFALCPSVFMIAGDKTRNCWKWVRHLNVQTPYKYQLAVNNSRVCVCRASINQFLPNTWWILGQHTITTTDHSQQQRARSPVIVDDEEGHLIYKNGDNLADRCSWTSYILQMITYSF